jgi:hypothetical protein
MVTPLGIKFAGRGIAGGAFQNWLDLKPGPARRAVQVKSPFAKGGFRGISSADQNPPCPSLTKGGKSLAANVTLFLKHTTKSVALPGVISRQQSFEKYPTL